MVFLAKDTFQIVLDSAPLVSIDLIVADENDNYLLGKRTNRPALGYWFVPGGRILKNESLDKAFTRLTEVELGKVFHRHNAKFIGAFDHFYDDCVFGNGVSTHYVALGHLIRVNRAELVLPKEQHSAYRWLNKQTLLAAPEVHKHSKLYLGSAGDEQGFKQD